MSSSSLVNSFFCMSAHQFVCHKIRDWYYARRRRRGALSDTAIRPSVCPSARRAAALGYRHTGCLQLSHVRTADPSADGRRSAANRNAIGGGISSGRPRGDNLLKEHSTQRHSICTISFFLSPAAKDIPVSSILPWHYPLIFCTAHSWTSQQFRLF